MKNNKREDRNKLFRKEIYEIYIKKSLEKAKICTYCGADADTVDHPFPLTYFSEDRDVAKKMYFAQGFRTIPSCRSCNNLASYAFSTSIAERKKTILDRFDKKYDKKLKGKRLTDEEIDEFDGMLKDSMIIWREQDDFLRLRRANLINVLPIYE